MECKNFKYRETEKCSFFVSNYLLNKNCMTIQILDENGQVRCTCTANMHDYMYFPNTATIKNYSENRGITEFLLKLGIIEKIYSRILAYSSATKGETIDFCLINIDKLKEYSSKFMYEWYSE